jgi:arylsulfatase A-like enzyme
VIRLIAIALMLLALPAHAEKRRAARMHVTPPDIVLVILDDVGWDDLAAVSAQGHAPNLTALGQQGFYFSNLRAAPVCSPTRRMVYAGDFYAEQSGPICPGPNGQEPPTTAVMLPEVLNGAGYSTALVGKWHVGGNPVGEWPDVTALRGFDRWRAGVPWYVAGNGMCGGNGYSFWTSVDDGAVGTSMVYQPTVMRQAFDALWPTMQGPRFAVYAAQLAHADLSAAEFHRPPDALLPGGSSYPPTPTKRLRYEAMIAALDTQIGQLLATAPNAVFVIVGDNGTPKSVAPDSTRAKTTTFQRGVRVPALIVGPGIPVGQSSALASIVDLYATVCAMAGATPPAGLDSRSLLPLVYGSATKVRDYCAYGIRGDAQFGHDDLAVSSLRYKYRRWRTRAQDGTTGPWTEEFYDLLTDPGELVNVVTDPTLAAKVAQHAAFLDQELP